MTKYKIRNKITGKEWGYLYNLQDAENAKLHLEDKGQNYNNLEILEILDKVEEEWK